MRSVKEIQSDIERLQVELAQAQEYALNAARAEVQRIMAQAGLTIQDVLGGIDKPAKPTHKGKSPVRFRLGDREWSGMGRKPAWALELGDQLEKHRVAS